MTCKLVSPTWWSLALLICCQPLVVHAQALPDNPPDQGLTAATLQQALYTNCVDWRVEFGPLTVAGTLTDLRAGDEAQVRMWVGGEDVRVHLTYGPRADGSTPPAPLTIGRHAGGVWCRPAGRLDDRGIANLIGALCLPFDCGLQADLLGMAAETPVRVKQSGDVTYYVIQPSETVKRWIDASDLTIVLDWRQFGAQVVATDFNEWSRIGEHGLYPTLAETKVDGTLVTRPIISGVEPRPHLVETFATPGIDPALLDVDPWSNLEEAMDLFEAPEEDEE